VRRSVTRNAKDEHELDCYLCAAPSGTDDEELIRVARPRSTRWQTILTAAAANNRG